MWRSICCVPVKARLQRAERANVMTVLLYQQRTPADSPWAGLLPPPPMLEIGGRPLLLWHLERIAEAGHARVLISVGSQTEAVSNLVAEHGPFGLHVDLVEPADGDVWDTVSAAKPRLSGAPVLTISADLWTDYDLSRLSARPGASAVLVMVDNTAYHPHGDFSVLPGGRVHRGPGMKLTFSGIGLFSPELLGGGSTSDAMSAATTANPLLAAFPLLSRAVDDGRVYAEHHTGPWTHVVHPDRLWDLDGVLDA